MFVFNLHYQLHKKSNNCNNQNGGKSIEAMPDQTDDGNKAVTRNYISVLNTISVSSLSALQLCGVSRANITLYTEYILSTVVYSFTQRDTTMSLPKMSCRQNR